LRLAQLDKGRVVTYQGKIGLQIMAVFAKAQQGVERTAADEARMMGLRVKAKPGISPHNAIKHLVHESRMQCQP
jgi:hypothetical protein